MFASECRKCRVPSRSSRSHLGAALTALVAVSIGATPLFQVQAQNVANSDARARQRLAWMREHQSGMWNVTPSEGAFLRDLVIKGEVKHALEIGTSNGYSGIWIATGLRQTGGHLLTLEIDEGRARLAQENFQAAGINSQVTLKLGDALQETPKLRGPFEFVFIDADKSDYVRYLRMVEPLVPPGGVIVAHNVSDLRSILENFIQAVKTDSQLKTTFENPGPGGFSVSVKLPSH